MRTDPPGPCTANFSPIGPSPEELQHKYRIFIPWGCQIAAFKRPFRADTWGVPGKEPHIRDRADRGYHPKKRPRLWDLYLEFACFWVIPGGYLEMDHIFGMGRLWASTPKRDPDSGTFIQNLPCISNGPLFKKYLTHGS